MLMCYLTVF